eukprot:6796654-Ditylum_brightwellii.AAC.1
MSPPQEVKGVKQPQMDLEALDMLGKLEDLPLWLIGGGAITTVMYVFGDASGGGFGSTFVIVQDVNYRFSLWNDVTSTSTSNLREGKNLYNAVETEWKRGRLDGTRMITQGTNELSRGNLQEGAIGRQNMLSYVPLNLSVLEVSLALKPWLESWMSSAT